MTFRELRNHLDQMTQRDLDKSIIFHMAAYDTEYVQAEFKHTKGNITLRHQFGDETPYIEIGY